MPKRAPALWVAPSVTPSPRSNILGLTVNPSLKLTSPTTPPEHAPVASPTLRAGLIVAPSLILSVRLVALPMRPPLAALPMTLKEERSIAWPILTVEPDTHSPIKPPALQPSAVVLIVEAANDVPPSSPMVSEADSANVFTNRPALPESASMATLSVPPPWMEYAAFSDITPVTSPSKGDLSSAESVATLMLALSSRPLPVTFVATMG